MKLMSELSTKKLADLSLSKGAEKINFSEEQFNALREIFALGNISDENYDLLDCSKVPYVYEGKKHWAEISSVDLENKDFNFIIDVYAHSNEIKDAGEWIFNLCEFNSLSDIPETYGEFIKLLDDRFMGLDEDFVSEYISIKTGGKL